jgi:hypothetical protein
VGGRERDGVDDGLRAALQRRAAAVAAVPPALPAPPKRGANRGADRERCRHFAIIESWYAGCTNVESRLHAMQRKCSVWSAALLHLLHEC